MTSCCSSANPNNLRFWQRESHGAAMFLGFPVWKHTNKRRIGSPSNTQTMKAKIGKYKPSIETMLAKANARSYGFKRPQRKYPTYTKLEAWHMARNLKSK